LCACICQGTINVEFELIAPGAFPYDSDVVPVRVRAILAGFKIFLATDAYDTVFLNIVRVLRCNVLTTVPVNINPGGIAAACIIVAFGNIGVVLRPGALDPEADREI